MISCRLCEPKKLTIWHYSSREFIVMDCAKCRIPMWVQRKHGRVLSKVKRRARRWCTEHFGGNVNFTGPKTIRNHYHEHVHVRARDA